MSLDEKNQDAKLNLESQAIQKKQPPKWKKAFSVVFLSLIIFVILAIILLIGYEKVYAEKTFLGVKIGSYDIGGKKSIELESLVKSYIEELNTQKINLQAGEKILNPSLKELGISFNESEIIQAAYQIGREKSYLKRYLTILEAVLFSKNVVLNPIIEKKSFENYIKENTDLIRDARNATLKVEDGKVIVVLSENGSQVNLSEFKTDLINVLIEGNINRIIVLKPIIEEPEITENDVIKIKPKVEKIVSKPLELIFGYNKRYLADAEILAGWLIIKKDNLRGIYIEFADEKIKEFIQGIADKIDRKPIDTKINAKTGSVIKEGSDGLVVDQEKLLTDIKIILQNPDDYEKRTVAIDVKKIPKGEKLVNPEEYIDGGTPGLYEGKYIEVDLSEQVLYAFEGTNLIGSYRVSTGKWSTPTPIGTRYIESKTERAYSNKYNLYMPYWNSIGGGYGIHELPEWASGYKEGESHLGTPVSHGCIRLGVGPAEFIYNWSPIGTPVYIHK